MQERQPQQTDPQTLSFCLIESMLPNGLTDNKFEKPSGFYATF
jgi:hypothetical protein